ncbi:hypothetical protein CY34DRAFT_812062 [Suillus luteus UH-Slu-Lm8-n1]|uniref:Uncharacterized protein n=1 Tax=Suillus luteus UH-Slu-Lm8-n1 TaxID=930992 RepID=A0A0D0AMV5_9AGAM|nr:hypothetical protein CY34DRAFT_812062 [Suillus luteus UH-Slu-Lm8-n1]
MAGFSEHSMVPESCTHTCQPRHSSPQLSRLISTATNLVSHVARATHRGFCFMPNTSATQLMTSGRHRTQISPKFEKQKSFSQHRINPLPSTHDLVLVSLYSCPVVTAL